MNTSFRTGGMLAASVFLLLSTSAYSEAGKLDDVLARGHLVLGTGSTNASGAAFTWRINCASTSTRLLTAATRLLRASARRELIWLRSEAEPTPDSVR